MADSTTWQRRKLSNWRRRIIPFGVWLAAASVAAVLLVDRSSTCELVGIAVPEQRSVAALANGRLRLMPIGLFETVRAGQTLAVLEDDQTLAALATAAAEVDRLRAEAAAAENRLAAEIALRQEDHLTQSRRYAVDVENNRVREVELQVTLASDRVRLDYLRLQKELLNGLRAQDAVSELQFRSAETDFAALDRKVTETQNTLEQVRNALADARRRQAEFAAQNVAPTQLDLALAPLRAAIAVQERRVDELSTEHALRVLKCPLDGKVSQLLRGVGETVRAGEPILTVVAARPAAVVVYAAPAQLSRLAEGAAVRLDLTRDGSVRHSAKSHVLAVGPAAEQLPARLWRNASIPEWGWPVRIALPPAMDLLSGETVGVAAQHTPAPPVTRTGGLADQR